MALEVVLLKELCEVNNEASFVVKILAVGQVGTKRQEWELVEPEAFQIQTPLQQISSEKSKNLILLIIIKKFRFWKQVVCKK